MAKKHRWRESDEASRVQWYKWEFLRRNSEYRRDYQELEREFGEWFRANGYWYDETKTWSRNALDFFMTHIGPRIKVICERWQIREPLPPGWRFKESGSRLYRRESKVFLPTNCFPGEAGMGWDPPMLSKKDLETSLPESTAMWYGPQPDYLLDLRFDLRLSLDYLLRKAKDQITSRKGKYLRQHPELSRVGVKPRRRLDLYAAYLKVWDLKRSGKTYAAIGKALFPAAFAPTQRAIDSFRRAQELINGGYKELR